MHEVKRRPYAEATSVRPSVRPHQLLNRLQDFHEIWYRSSWWKVELHKNWLRSSQTLLKGVNEFVPGLSIFFCEYEERYTNHRGQVTQATKFYMVAPNVWRSSVCNLLYVTQKQRIFRWFLHL